VPGIYCPFHKSLRDFFDCFQGSGFGLAMGDLTSQELALKLDTGTAIEVAVRFHSEAVYRSISRDANQSSSGS